MAHFWIIAFFIPSVLCAEGNNLRNQQRVNLAPGAGGYGSNDMEDNYDYILDDTPPRGKNMDYFKCNILVCIYVTLWQTL